VTYYLRSSVLGGAVATELLQSGAKKRSFVYAGTQMLAWQDADYFGGQRVIWEHRDPSNASFRATDANGNLGGLTIEDDPAELDPSGSNAGLLNPYELVVPPPDDEAGPPLLTYPNNGNPIQWGTSYTRDGIPISRSDAMELIGRLPSGNLSLLYMSAAASRPRLRNYEVENEDGVRDFGLNRNLAMAVARETGGTLIRNWLVSDGWNFFSSLMDTRQNPEQRLTENEYLTLRSHITKALESKECRDFINTLVSYNQSGKPFDSQNQLTKLAEDVYNSPDGGMFWRPGHGGQENAKRKFWIGQGGPFNLNSQTYANELTHLLIHQVTTGSDDVLSRNIRDLKIVPTRKDGTPLDFPTGMKDGKPFNDFSNYWDTALRRVCFPSLPF
jgi:hypothetical protein